MNLVVIHIPLFLLTLFPGINSQISKLFGWGFTATGLSQALPACENMTITVTPSTSADNSTRATPPYYMLAYPAVDGIPTRSHLGSDEGNLHWVVDQPVGAELFLDVVDANGNPGGIPPRVYQVIATQSTQCLPSAPTTNFTVTGNVTGGLDTCRPWGLTIKGGTPPYSLTFAALDSPGVTNVSLPFNDNVYSYINRVEPGGQLIAAVSDATGRWARGVPRVQTQGSTNITCPGLVSSSSNSTMDQQEGSKARAENGSRKRTSIIIGVCVTLAALLLLSGLLFVFLHIRKKNRDRIYNSQDVEPRQFTQSEVIIGSPKSPQAYSLEPVHSSSNPFQDSNVGDEGREPSSSGRLGFSNFPSRSLRADHKAIEAGFAPSDPSIADSPISDHTTNQLLMGRNNSTTTQTTDSRWPMPISPSVSESDPAPGEVIFQHQDAGIVRELPPPYADRTSSRVG